MNKNSRIVKFFLLGVIPFIFTTVLIVALLIFAGVDVGASVTKFAQNLPLVGKHFMPEGDRVELQQRKIEQLTAELSEHKEQLRQLEQQLQAEQEKYTQLEAQNEQRIAREEAEAEQQWIDSYKQVAKSLARMSASKSAPIISQMPPQESLMVLYVMKDAEQSQLLSKLPPDQAAVFATMLKELVQQSHHMTLAQASAEAIDKYGEQLAEATDDREPADWALAFASMPPANAAAILEQMDESRVLSILRELDVSARASILSSLEAERASRLSQQLVDSG